MNDQEKTREQLVQTLAQSRRQTEELKTSKAELERTKEALRGEINSLKIALESAEAGTWSVDVLEGARTWNDHCPQLFGLPRGTFRESYQDWLDRVHPDDRGRVQREYTQSLEELTDYQTEYRVIWPDGSVHAIASKSKVFTDQQGRAVRMTGVCWDITERKRTEEAIRESEDKFHRLFENAPLGYQSLDENGNFVELNDTWCKLLGYTKEEVLGRNFSEFIHPDFREHFKENFPKFKSMGYILGVEFEMIKKDGSEIIVAFDGKIGRHEDGSFKQTHCILSDISERKRAEEAILASEQKYRALFEGSADATLIIDDNKFVDCNDAVVQMLRYRNRADLLRTHPSELSPPMQPDGRSSYEKADEMMAIAYERGSHRFEWDHKRADSEVFPVEVLLTAIPVGEKKILHVVWRDITKRKRIEREREDLIAKLESQNAELERFTYTVSHDLKSPLITTKGYIDILREDLAQGSQEQVEDDLSRISAAADKMDILLRDLLELSRIGRSVNPPEDVPLAELVNDALERVGGQVDDKGVQVDISPNLPTIFGDRLRLLEVLQNLIDNAVKYMGDQPRPRIEIGSRRDGGDIVCYVRDNGIGIEPRYHDKIFGLFDQLDQNVEGSGIGLALVRRIIEVHGGRIWIESEGPGQGTTFCFTIPPKSESQ